MTLREPINPSVSPFSYLSLSIKSPLTSTHKAFLSLTLSSWLIPLTVQN